MKKIKCIKLGNVQALTVGELYEIINESDTRFSIINDKGIQKNYCKSLFEKPKKEKVEKPKPQIPVVDEIDINTEIINNNNNQAGFKIDCNFNNIQNYSFQAERLINHGRITASCGVYSLDGLNNILQELDQFKENLVDFIAQNNQVFTLNPEINIDELYVEICKGVFQDLIAFFQGAGHRCAILILSTTFNTIEDFPVVRDILNEISINTIEAHNPNSGNDIIMWNIKIDE